MYSTAGINMACKFTMRIPKMANPRRASTNSNLLEGAIGDSVVICNKQDELKSFHDCLI